MLHDLWKPIHLVRLFNFWICFRSDTALKGRNKYSPLVTSDCGPYGRYTLPNYNTLCVGYNGRTSGCNGDSGGPLICESGKSKYF